MSVLTSLTRMWLTRSIKPFTFTSDYDKTLSYLDCKNMGIYIHIPFCKNICNFCPYCKVPYNEDICNKYIDALIQEIELVCHNTKKKKKITSLYFGGGTPAIIADRLSEIIATVEKYFIITEGIGIELHPDNVTVEILSILQKSNISKLSIGIQSFQKKYQNILGRNTVDAISLKNTLSNFHFDTVSMDFIFALPDQTLTDLQMDIDTAFSCGANHIAIYPFIDFTFTPSKVKAMNKKEKRTLLDSITKYCEEKGLERDSIWTFKYGNNVKYSSMTRDNFLGFGVSATTLLQKQFKINTFSIEAYCNRIFQKELPTSLTIKFTKRQRMLYYLFWTAYSTKINLSAFENFFGVPLKKMYGLEISIAKLLGFITENNGIIEMTLKGAFYYHYYENFYTLAYIDKMWGIMREEAFPKELQL